MSAKWLDDSAFGTRNDWSTWTGPEIGTRIVHYLNSKMDHAFGDLSASQSSSKLSAYFRRNSRETRSCRELLVHSHTQNGVNRENAMNTQCSALSPPLSSSISPCLSSSLPSSSLSSSLPTSPFIQSGGESRERIEGMENKENIAGPFSPQIGKIGTNGAIGILPVEISKIVNENMLGFYSYSEPPISLCDYVKRLINYTRISISPVNLAVALFYIERVEKKGACEVNKYSIFRLFAVAYLVAYKYFDDPPVMKNNEFCKIAGIPLPELNRLELCFLIAIDFELGVRGDIALSQKITRILVPHKLSPEIIIGDRMSNSLSSKALLDINRWTPDSVIDTEHDHHWYFGSSHCSSSSSHNFLEDDEDNMHNNNNMSHMGNNHNNNMNGNCRNNSMNDNHRNNNNNDRNTDRNNDYYNYNFNYGEDNIDYEHDDVFDRRSVYNNYSQMFHRTSSNRMEEDNVEEFESNFYEDDHPYNPNHSNHFNQNYNNNQNNNGNNNNGHNNNNNNNNKFQHNIQGNNQNNQQNNNTNHGNYQSNYQPNYEASTFQNGFNGPHNGFMSSIHTEDGRNCYSVWYGQPEDTEGGGLVGSDGEGGGAEGAISGGGGSEGPESGRSVGSVGTGGAISAEDSVGDKRSRELDGGNFINTF